MAGHRVLYFITELNVGGAERSLARLLAGLDRSRYEPIVACLYGSESPVADQICALGIPVYDLGMPHKWRVDAFVRLYRLLRRVRPAILHTLLFHANISGRVVAGLARVPADRVRPADTLRPADTIRPIVISGERTMGMESRWRYLLNRITHHLADRVVCVSQQVAGFVVTEVGVPRDKIVVIPNGVEVAQCEPLPGSQGGVRRIVAQHRARSALGLPVDGVLVGTVARLDPVKRLDVFLQALASLDDVQAVIVGYGPEERRLTALAGRLRIADRVRFAGQQRDVCPWLAALDVFVLSSDWEGMSNALLEAMAAGLPVVATATGGTPDVVIDGSTGYLVPVGDAPELARAIQTLLSDAEQRERMGQAGRRRVLEHFSVEQMAERTQALYSSLLAERAALLDKRGA